MKRSKFVKTWQECSTRNAVRRTLFTLFLVLLLSGFNGQAMAATFADGDLVRVVYSATGGMETATDLGPISNLTTASTSTVTYNTNNFSIGSLGTGATYANSYVAYYAHFTDSAFNTNAWTSGNSGGQTVVGSLAGSSFANAAVLMDGTYQTATGASTGQVTIAISKGGSYYTNMDFSGLGNGEMAGYTPNGDAEKNLAGLATTGYVDQPLYYYIDDGSVNGSRAVVADIRTYTDGHTELNPVVTSTQYVLTVNKTGTGSGTVTSSPSGVTCGLTCSAQYNSGTAVTLTATANSGSTFTSWTGCDSTSGNTCSITMTSAKKVTATFTLNSLTVTPSAGTGGSISPSAPQTVAFDGTTSFTVTPNTGYYIASVTGCVGKLSGSTYTTGQVTADCSVSATFAQTAAGEYLLTVSDAGTGSGAVNSTPAGISSCGSTCSAQYSSGTSVTLTATPASGSSFNGWSGGDCSGAGNCTVTLSAATTVTATFTSNSLTVTPSAGTGGSLSPSTPQTAAYNGTVSFTVTPNTGYNIASVTGCGGTLSGKTYTTGPVTANCTVSAVFAQTGAGQFALTVTTTGNGTVTTDNGTLTWSGSTGTASYSSGTEVTLTAAAASGSSFTGWSGSGCSGTGTCTVTMNANTSVSAAFAEAVADFNDVPTDYWAYGYIHAIHEAGLTQGCGNNNYCPSDSVTRGEMAAFITRELLGPNFTSYSLTPYFTDVPQTSPWFKYVQRLKDDGIITVWDTLTAPTIFNVDEIVARDEMAAFLVRARQLQLGMEVVYQADGSPDNLPVTPNPWFSDVPSTDTYFKYVQYLKDNNITTVTGTYNPASNVTRDEMAAFLARAFLGMK